MARVVIHTNLALANQRATARWLQEGFQRHGLEAEITPDVHAAGDIHVVQGPHYAFRQWLGKPNVLWLDRCFYGDEWFDLSIGWLNPDGTRDFRNQDKTEPNGTLPELKPMKERRHTAIVFGDYGTDPMEMILAAQQRYRVVDFRPHPAEKKPTVPLEQIWEEYDVAIGCQSTALVEAKINGLHVDCYDPSYVVNDTGPRSEWLMRLSWAQWNSEAIRSGEMWDHLCT